MRTSSVTGHPMPRPLRLSLVALGLALAVYGTSTLTVVRLGVPPSPARYRLAMNIRRQIDMLRGIACLNALLPVVATLFKPEGVNATVPLASAIILIIVSSKLADRLHEAETSPDVPK